MSNAMTLTKAKAAYEAAESAVDRAFARRSKAIMRLMNLGYVLRHPKPRKPRIEKLTRRR